MSPGYRAGLLVWLAAFLALSLGAWREIRTLMRTDLAEPDRERATLRALRYSLAIMALGAVLAVTTAASLV